MMLTKYSCNVKLKNTGEFAGVCGLGSTLPDSLEYYLLPLLLALPASPMKPVSSERPERHRTPSRASLAITVCAVSKHVAWWHREVWEHLYLSNVVLSKAYLNTVLAC